ncbi:MAG: flagellar basal body-associated FliL family protein [Desulfurivibrionaceae bacterium]
MADDHPQSDDQPAAPDNSAAHEEINWGEDWESAFQSEDDAFFSEGKHEDFFLEENEPPVSAENAPQELDSSLAKNLSGIPDSGVASAAHQGKAIFTIGAITSIFLSGKTAAQKQFTRLQSLPIFVRIPLYALPFLLIGLMFALTGTPKLPSLEQQQGVATGSSVKTEISLKDGQASQLHPGKLREKWGFPSFIIPVANPASDQPVTFVLVDITFIASLDDQEELSAEKKIFVRDIIYQFFQNKPLEDLRHFSLARGDMNKELRAWLLKQWPEAPIESIIFNQYHLS